MIKHDVCDGLFIINTWWYAMWWYVYLDVDKYGDVGFIPILMCDDDVLLCRVCDVMLSSHR